MYGGGFGLGVFSFVGACYSMTSLSNSSCRFMSLGIRARTCSVGSLLRIGPQGGTLIFSCIHRLESFFGVQNFEFQYFWGFSEKNKCFFGMKIMWIFFWGHHKIGLYLWVISETAV